MAFGGPANVLKLVQAKRPMLTIDEYEIEVELSQNVDHPRGWEGKVVPVRLASGAQGGFDSVGLLHRTSSAATVQSSHPLNVCRLIAQILHRWFVTAEMTLRLAAR